VQEPFRLKRFICVQMGARRGYAVPAILERAGLLERFYTDICGDIGIGRMASRLSNLPFVGASFARLAGRRLPESIREKTYTFSGAALRHALCSSRVASNIEAKLREQIRFDGDIGKAMIFTGYGSATHIYSMLGEGGPFIAEAHKRGLQIVSEVYISLSADNLLRTEREAYPGWESDVPDYKRLRREFGAPEVLVGCTDYFICPSHVVRDDLVSNWGVPERATVVVPYGVDPTWLALEARPVRGRVLFVGSATLRKGIHYLAMAAEKLAARGYGYDFRVAGDVTDEVKAQPACKHLTFLGRIPRDRIHREFQEADLFVLPSLAEGSAGATYEALAAGLPVITTKATGSVVRDGIEGRLIAERDTGALAEAIEELLEDRLLRDRLALAARARARDHDWGRYGERLVESLQILN
jgi:glycosyltransferase involved in cell wall biosynthesis